MPAGVAPVYPWIYAGGLDPLLWAPISGVQTLNFVPYRLDLTPFAGVLSDGQLHTVARSVYNAELPGPQELVIRNAFHNKNRRA